MAQTLENQGGCLYSFGKGSFYALMLLVLPFVVVTFYYDEIRAKVDGISALPVFHEMTRDFKTGAELAGFKFKEQLAAFYADSLVAESRPFFQRKHSYWSRKAVETQLTQKMSRGYHRNIAAYLDYIEKFRDIALEEMRRTKIPASITLAQGFLPECARAEIMAIIEQCHEIPDADPRENRDMRHILISEDAQVQVSPNPAKDWINIVSVRQMEGHAEVYALTGQLVASRNIAFGDNPILFDLNSGGYVLRIIYENGDNLSHKLVINK